MYAVLGFVLTIAYVAFMGATLFLSAGTLREPIFWAYVVELGVLFVFAGAIVYVRSPDLMKERIKPGAGEQDRVSLPVANLLLFATWVIAGADVGRFHWSSSIPFWLQVVGFVGMAVGFAVVLWAMLINRFFSSAVRLQADRDQVVITSGPYRYVRHPGYTGGILFLLCSGLSLGSWLALVPMIVLAAFFIRRTLLEDRMLGTGLTGYTDYAQRVRYRLVPGVW